MEFDVGTTSVPRFCEYMVNGKEWEKTGKETLRFWIKKIWRHAVRVTDRKPSIHCGLCQMLYQCAPHTTSITNTDRQDTKRSKKTRLSRLHNSRHLFTDLKPVESSSHPDAIIVTSLQRLLSCPPFNTWRPFPRDFHHSVCNLFRSALPDQTISIISNERHY